MSKCGLVSVFCLVSVWVVSTHGVNDLVKRSDDGGPLQAVIDQLANDMSSVQAKLTELEALKNDVQLLKDKDNERVTFTAYISESSIPSALNGVIRFSHKVTNTGNAYNSNTGAFTAPYDGDYMFIVSVDTSPDYGALSINKNGHSVVFGHNDGGTGRHITTLCVLTLDAHDTVTVNHATTVGSVDGGYESIFAGFRIR